MEKTEEKKKGATKVRREEYWRGVASLALKLGTLSQDDFVQILKEVDEKLGYKPASTNLEPVFTKIFGPVLETELLDRPEESRGVGKRKIMRIYSFKKGTDENMLNDTLKEYYADIKKKISTGMRSKAAAKKANGLAPNLTISEADKQYRDAYIKKALEIQKQEGIERKEAVKKARKSLRRPRAGNVVGFWKLSKLLQRRKNWDANSKDIRNIFGKTLTKQAFQKMLKKLELWEIKFHADFTEENSKDGKRMWKIVVRHSPEDIATQLESWAKTWQIKLPKEEWKKREEDNKEVVKKTMVITPAKVDDMSENMKYVVFVIAGLIKRSGNRGVQLLEIGSILRGNHYHRIETTDQDLKSIIKAFPKYFRLGMQNSSVVLEDPRYWEREIQEEYHPRKMEWRIPWVINSGLELDEVKKFFPKSYQIREDVRTSTKVIMVVTDRSILSYINLARLQEKMRDCDFPVGANEANLSDNLKKEAEILNRLTETYLLGRTNDMINKLTTTTDKDKILIQIEEGYI